MRREPQTSGDGSQADRDPPVLDDLQALLDEALRDEAQLDAVGRPRSVRRERPSPLLIISICAVAFGVCALAASAVALSSRGVGALADASVSASAPTPTDENEVVVPESPTTERRVDPFGADPKWLRETAQRTGIPERALSGYTRAASRLANEQPLCGIGWNTLAGIGFVESEHGTIHGGTLAVNGRAEPEIRGIALDGTSTDAIPDTDGGLLDQDTVWDRAVGPMQFIPSTWEQWASDGDGDGVTDPQHIDDAAYTAARYLCGIGQDLRASSGWIAAVAAYNDTVDYNHRVAAAAEEYARQSSALSSRAPAASGLASP